MNRCSFPCMGKNENGLIVKFNVNGYTDGVLCYGCVNKIWYVVQPDIGMSIHKGKSKREVVDWAIHEDVDKIKQKFEEFKKTEKYLEYKKVFEETENIG